MGNLLKKYSKIEFTYVVKIPVCRKSVQNRVLFQNRVFTVLKFSLNIDLFYRLNMTEMKFRLVLFCIFWTCFIIPQ